MFANQLHSPTRTETHCRIEITSPKEAKLRKQLTQEAPQRLNFLPSYFKKKGSQVLRLSAQVPTIRFFSRSLNDGEDETSEVRIQDTFKVKQA